MKVDIELILAALIEQSDGELFLGEDYLKKSYEGMVIAMAVDAENRGMLFELVNESEVTYDDE
jgi:hypothetical protein